MIVNKKFVLELLMSADLPIIL